MSEKSSQPRSFLSRPQVVESLCLVLALAALHPLLTPGYMWGHDTGAHMFRLVEVARALSEGVLYPRFLPDAYGGLGGPILNFNPAAPYYLPALLVLLGLGPVAALKISAGIYLVAGGLAMRTLARPHAGRIGAAVAGLAWVYLPYRIANLYVRMAFSELAVMVVLPLAMAAARRAVARPTGKRMAMAGLLMGLMPAVHFPGSVIGLPLVAVYALSMVAGKRRLGAALVFVACSALALALSAFSWLPALAEIGSTHYLDSTGGYDNYTHHFVAPGQLVSPGWGFGSSMPGATDTMSFQVGWAHLLALAGALLLGLPARSRRAVALFCAVVASTGIFLMLEISRPLWEVIPVLQNVQFPWRNLMLVGVATSLSAGCIAAWMGAAGGRGPAAGKSRAKRGAAPGPAGLGRALPMVVAAVVVAACLPYLQSREGEGSDDDFTPESIRQRYFGELKFQPVEVATPRFRPRGARADLLGEGEARIVEESTHRMRVMVSAPAPTLLRLHLFSSPGWTATIEGSPAPLTAQAGTGLVMVQVPAGGSELLLRYRNTPVRTAGWILSALGLAVSAAGLLSLRGRKRR